MSSLHLFVSLLLIIMFDFYNISYALDINSNNEPHPHGITSSDFNTIINYDNNHYNIIGGIQKDGNLFHSFGQFNIHSHESAAFNDAGIVNTIGRITGQDY
ncbi:filamentous hemagglutinin outer membrane protein, partial [Candidatus Magnetomorum sp. HK-1]